MKMRFLYLFLIFVTPLLSQQSNTLYYMYRAPQAGFLNPARQYPCRFNMSVPLLSSIHVNYGNTAFSINSVSDVSGDSMQLNTAKIAKATHNLDHISTEIHYTLFSMGFNRNEVYYNFSLTEKNELHLSIPNDMFDFVLKGNAYFMDNEQEVKLNRLGMNMLHYREYSFGAAYDYSEDLHLGFRAKLLFGKANVNTRKSDIRLSTNPDTYEPTVSSNTQVNASFPLLISMNSQGYISGIDYDPSVSITKLIFNPRNPGLAIDGGLFYDYTDKLSLSASFNDLGIIRWGSFQQNITQNGSYTYSGKESLTSDANMFMEIIDTVRTRFAPSLTSESYYTMLPLKIYGGGEYRINRTFRVGLLGRLWMYQYRIHPSIIAHGSATLTRFLTLNLSWAYNNYTLANLGAGLTMQTKNLQFYVVADNLSGLIWWQTARNVNARLGMNLFFGCAKKRGAPKCAGCYWYQVMEEKRKRRE